MKRQHSYLKMPKKKLNSHKLIRHRNCKRCLEESRLEDGTRYCNKCKEILDG